jgi:voltage-gated potassium channel
MSGLGNFENATEHMVIVGYVEGQTERLIEETSPARGKIDAVIVSMRDVLPLTSKISRIRTTSLSNTPDLLRAGTQGAKAIVVMAETDDETMAAALAISALGTKAHVVVYFRDDAKADLVRPHCAGFEFVVSTSVQQVSRAIVDPGASQVLAHLSSTTIGATLNSMDYQGAKASATQLRDALAKHGATLIGYRLDDGKEPTLTFSPETELGPEHTLFYISEHRLRDDLQLAV